MTWVEGAFENMRVKRSLNQMLVQRRGGHQHEPLQ